MKQLLLIALISIGCTSCVKKFIEKTYICSCTDNKGNTLPDTEYKDLNSDIPDTECMMREVNLEAPHTVGDNYDATCTLSEKP